MKRFQAGLALAFTMTIGCVRSHPPATAKAPACADAAANNERVILAMGAREGQDMTMMATAGREVYAERCPADGWSQEIVTCAANAPGADEIMACVEQLTPAQHQGMVDAFGAKMGGGGGQE